MNEGVRHVGTVGIALALALAAGCKPSKPAPKKAAGYLLTEYAERRGAYSCLVPAEWNVKEGSGASRDVMFFGPRGVSLAIAPYPEGDAHVKTPKDYVSAMKLSGGEAGDPSESELNGRPATRLVVLDKAGAGGGKTYSRRLDAVLIAVPGGFWALEHRAPEASHAATLPVLEACAASFQPKG